MAKHVSDLTPNDLYELGHVYAPHIYALIQQQHILFTTTCDNKTFFFFMSLGRRWNWRPYTDHGTLPPGDVPSGE